MCGLVGIYSSNMLTRHKKAMADLLFLDTFRGRDSTGVAAIRKNADTDIMKSTVPGYEFIEGPALGEHLKLTDFCWIGHNRYGTIGRNTKSNAHPFTADDDDGCALLVGAHNGTLKSKHRLPDHLQYGTDSEALYNGIARLGLEEVLKDLEGAWALTWYDHVEEELRFLRNAERPLHFAWEEDGRTLLWASEAWMLRIACSRNGIKLREDKVYMAAEDTLYRMPVPLSANDEIKMERKGGLVGKQTTAFFRQHDWAGGTAAKPRNNQATTQGNPAATQPPKVVTNPSQATTNSQSGTTNSKGGAKPTTPSGTSSSSPLSSGNVRDILSAKTYKGYRGEPLSKKELEDQMANGCAWCEETFIDPYNDRFAWLGKGAPVCTNCLSGKFSTAETDGGPNNYEPCEVKASRLVH